MKLKLESIRKVYSHEAIGVDRIDLEVDEGEMTVLLGPSGCGKTTLLRLICGLEKPDSGAIYLDGRDITDWEPKRRDIAMVFQNYALYPHMTVRENLEFGLKARKIQRQQIEESVGWAAELLGLQKHLNRKPKDLSGGQRQRVALGRAIVRRPKLYLFDEPLSNLDAELRMRMRGEILALHRRVHGTSIYVTHDQVEAMSLADRIFIMKEGKIVASGPPGDLYRDPPDLFTAGFLGFPAMNLIEGKIEDDNFISAGGLIVPLGGRTDVIHGTAVLGIRPESITIVEGDGISCEISSLENLGGGYSLLIRTGNGDRFKVLAKGEFRPGDQVKIELYKAEKFIFDSSTGKRHYTQ